MNWFEPSDEERQGFAAWCADRPEAVRAIAERFPIWGLLTIKTTGQTVYPVAYAEDGTLRVARDPEWDWLAGVYHEVFGIKPDDLEPCDEPRILKDKQGNKIVPKVSAVEFKTLPTT